MQATQSLVSGQPALDKESQRQLVLQYLRRSWQTANQEVRKLEEAGQPVAGFQFNQRLLIAELAQLVNLVRPADIDVKPRQETFTEFQCALMAVMAGVLDFRSGMIDGKVLELDYRIGQGVVAGSRIECARRYGYLFGLEPRVSQLGHGSDVTGLIVIRRLK